MTKSKYVGGLRAYYIVIENGEKHCSDVVWFDNEEVDVKVHMHGLMFEEGWCPDTDHAIYIGDDRGYSCMFDQGNAQRQAQDMIFESSGGYKWALPACDCETPGCDACAPF
jgi:hypothetical protein